MKNKERYKESLVPKAIMSIDDDYTEDLSNDVCPICKTDKYLNSNMVFLINTECYHKMCDSCVDRIFSLGPTKCPYPQCDKILRKLKFKTQIFEDIKVEKEIDIRKKIFKIFNKLESEFKSLKEYNTYIEKIEELIYNLLHKVNLKETNEYIDQYQKQNSKLIRQNNINLARNQELFLKKELEKDQLNLKKKEAARRLIKDLIQEEKMAKLQITNGLLNSSMESDMVVETVKRNLLKQTSARRKKFMEETRLLNEQLMDAIEEEEYILDGTRKPTSRRAKFLLEQKKLQQLSPFTPFNGDRTHIFDDIQEDYLYFDLDCLSKIADDEYFLAGGVRPAVVVQHGVFESLMGLNCIIEEEKAVQ